MNTKNRILILDGEPLNLEILEFTLNKIENLEILVTLNKLKALSYVRTQKIDLVILDLSTHDSEGLEVLQTLKEEKFLRHIPVIVMTSNRDDRELALELGAEDFLSKPVDTVELQFKVNNFLKFKKFNDLQHFFNKRLQEEVGKKEDELRDIIYRECKTNIAHQVQHQLFPTEYSKEKELDIYGYCIPAPEVSGNYFDIFKSACKRYTFFILADSSLSGFSSTLILSQFRTLCRMKLIDSSVDLKQEIEELNRVFCRDNQDETIALSAIFLRYDHENAVMELVNAAQHDPLGGVKTKSLGKPLGLEADTHYATYSFPFVSGQALLLYSSGAVNCENEHGLKYGNRLTGLYDCIQAFSSQEQVEVMHKAIEEFVDEQRDDVTLLAIKAI